VTSRHLLTPFPLSQGVTKTETFSGSKLDIMCGQRHSINLWNCLTFPKLVYVSGALTKYTVMTVLPKWILKNSFACDVVSGSCAFRVVLRAGNERKAVCIVLVPKQTNCHFLPAMLITNQPTRLEQLEWRFSVI